MPSRYRRRLRRTRGRVVTARTSLYRPIRSVPSLRSPPRYVSDRRRYNPTRVVSAPYSSRRSATRLRDRSRSLTSPTVIGFADPRKVEICRRREERRQVLHAKGVAGGRVRKPRRNKWSGVSCRS